MKSRSWGLAAVVVFVLSAGAGAFEADEDDDSCRGRKPFREVAQDETHTMAELCMMQERRWWTNLGVPDSTPTRDLEAPVYWRSAGASFPSMTFVSSWRAVRCGRTGFRVLRVGRHYL